jgi:hypothetical protein
MYFFEYMGAFYVWLFRIFISKISGVESPTFSDILAPKEEEIEMVDLMSTGLKHKFIGAFITMFICYLLTLMKV